MPSKTNQKHIVVVGYARTTAPGANMPALIHIDDALAFIVDFVRNPRNNSYPVFGYEFWLPNIVVAYVREVERRTEHNLHNSARVTELSPPFYDAAWEFCRRGIFRPGLVRMGEQATTSGGSGDGFSLTEFGRVWLAQGSPSIPLQVGRLENQFQKVAEPFGKGFLQRANEAVSTYRFGAYLACCAMCGAAAESIFLAVAIAKTGDEPSTLATYRGAQGRRALLNLIVGKARSGIADPFRSAAGLISYWRDEAAHGMESTISEIEAHEALARLLRFAQFALDNWTELTKKDG